MKKNKEIAIQLSNISKRYEIHHDKPTLAETLLHGRNELFWALRDINLSIRKGERVGIIGPNGSGKTTLLKIISGIATPTTGTVQTTGRLVSLINLEAGFLPELSGIQNIYLNGMILNMSKREIDAKIDAIVKYADIGRFVDAPMFTYSDGMKLKLGFSITIHTNPDILILDESMYVGDQKFQDKALRTIEKFYKMHTTILIVTHWLSYVKNNCDRIIVLEKGRIAKNGSKKLVDNFYRSMQGKNLEYTAPL